MSEFYGKICIENADNTDDGQWLTTAQISYESDELNFTISVPPLFQTDLASVPRLFAIYALFGGRANQASVIHDYLYTFQPCTRRQADAVLYEAMRVTSDPKWMSFCMWLGVRIGGWWPWLKHRNIGRQQPILDGSAQ